VPFVNREEIMQLGSFLRHVRRAGQSSASAGLSDAQLLDRFARDREEAAFEVLLWRHAPVVLGVCRRLLHDEQQAEDVFQATFLVLVRKAGSISRREALGSWLYKVAYRIALRARSCSVRRARESAAGVDHLEARPGRPPEDIELRSVLDEEISRLPAAYRSAVVLCWLEGHTQESAARQLGCAASTVAWRLAQARERLRLRLTNRGPGACLGMLAAGLESALVQPGFSLIETTTDAALAFARGDSVAGSAAALAEGVLSMPLHKAKALAAVLLIVGLLGLGAGLFARPSAKEKAAPGMIYCRSSGFSSQWWLRAVQPA
jgi:HlyD family secretion protein